MSIDVGEISQSDKQFGGKRKRTEVQSEAEDEGLRPSLYSGWQESGQ